jgi:hypothetical protein
VKDVMGSLESDDRASIETNGMGDAKIVSALVPFH